MNLKNPGILSLSILAISLGLGGCNTNDHDVDVVTSKTLIVTPSLGRISNARVVLRNSVTHAEIGSQALINGQATFQVPASVNAVLAEVVPETGATYFDEGTGSNQPLPAGTQLRAAFTLTAPSSNVGVTALTEAAVQRAE
ncbi:MAG TPA: hypothetical protein VFW49_00885, partial [Fluviicoccus sp.]|nr:hypothetical protein [Fluviicoccus sp.]